ncbi:DUF2332 domain-containing protein [Maritalea myrionectae]|uniref:DUF2332 domain-containing protein n=1 Tax=Maritalea myrionectae TaxID=454601 RepID=UPI000423EF42|nr:DUF2332 family protein [Maritalea myrionectae]
MNNSQILARHAKFNQACEMQAEACAALGSPFTAQLCTLMAKHHFSAAKIEEKLANWPGDVTYRTHSVPLRMCGALNSLARSGQAPALTALYPPHHAKKLDAAFWQVLDRAVVEFEEQILTQLEFAPQTNEVRRANGLMPALLHLSAAFDRPIKLYEMGASAGLNLVLDQFAYQFADEHYGPQSAPFTLQPDWQGPTPPHANIDIVHRAGCDLNPLDVSTRDGKERLMSYIWPDQMERVERTEHAIELATHLGVKVDKRDAATWLKHQLASMTPGHLHVVYNTVAFQYFPTEAQNEIRALLVEKGRTANPNMQLVWLQIEADNKAPGFAITQQVWPGGDMVELARIDAHGRWVTWHQA